MKYHDVKWIVKILTEDTFLFNGKKKCGIKTRFAADVVSSGSISQSTTLSSLPCYTYVCV